VRAPDGGGGSVILIDPDSLRTAAGRLKGIAGDLQMIESVLSDVGYPNMPPGTYAVVQPAVASSVYSISSEIVPLMDTPTELTRRAFWAEYADRMMSGYVLTGTAKKEFEQWLADGTLLKYASPDEARAAGVELAKVSGDFQKDPRLLITLAADLKGAETATDEDVRRAFSAGFVNQFGAKNMELVPRVIQAMESPNGLTGIAGGADPRSLAYTARMWQEQGVTLTDLKLDPLKDLLAPFSIALANATYSGQVTRTVEDDIANDDDAWATAALLSQGDKFGTHFLLGFFKSGVVDRIVQDSPYHEIGSLEQPPGAEPYNLGWTTGHPLSSDPKSIIMEALARNKHAALEALTRPIDVQPADPYGQRETVTDPMQLLYQYGHFDDHGEGFGHAYAAATDLLDADPTNLADLHQGSLMTQKALNYMLNPPDLPGLPDQSAFKDGLAHDLAQHHIKDLFDSAVANDPGDGKTFYIGSEVDGSPLQLTQTALTDTLKDMASRSSAFSQILHAGSIYQAALIDHGTAQPPGSPTDWAYKAGAFDASVLNAGDLHRLDDFNASDERHQLITGFFKDVVNDTIEIDNPVAGAIVHNGVDAAIDSAFPGPDANDLITDNSQAKALMTNSLHAAITSGYYNHGQITGTMPPAGAMNGNQLASYGNLDGSTRFQFEQWMNGDSHVEQATREAMQEASRAYQERSIDLIR
jgi:hypothetical protein